MSGLAQTDVEALLGFLRAQEEADDEGSFATGVIAGLRMLVPCDAVGYNHVDPSSGEASWLADPVELGEAADVEAFARTMHEHPVIDSFARTGDGRAAMMSDYLSARAFHRLELYADFYRPLEFEHQLDIEWTAADARFIAIALHRRQHEFSERDRLLLDLLRPYLALGQRNARMRQDTRVLLSALDQAHHSLQTAIVVVGPGDQVELISGPAEHWLSSYFGAPLPGRLPEEVEQWIVAQRKRLDLDGDLPPLPSGLLRDGESGRLSVRFVRASRPGERDCLLLTEQRPERISRAHLRALGLTTREAEVLFSADSEMTRTEIGHTLHISPLTVKKHLEHIYRKLDVKSRTAAVARARQLADRT